jgi:hypothetical protein
MDTELSQGHESHVLARELARSGMNVASGQAHRDWDNAVSFINNDLASVEQEGGDFQAAATQLSPTSIELDVTGTYGPQAHHLKRTLVLAGPLDGAYVVDVPQVSPTFVESLFLIDGEDRRPFSVGGSLPSTALHKPGLKTNSILVRNAFGTALAGRTSRVHGAINDEGDLGSGSLKADVNWEVDLEALYEEAVNHPDKQTFGVTIDGSPLGLTIGSPTNPVIAHVPSSTLISGEVTGYGILVVEGNLMVMDEFIWEGIVLVRQDAGDLSVNYGGNAVIYGSLIVVQRTEEDWAFTMPTDGRLQVTYKYSSAGYGSEVWIDPWGMSEDLLFERGSNRTGDQMDVYDVLFRRGQRMNFFINVEGCETGTTECDPKSYWDHYAAGHVSPGETAYAEIEQLGDYQWEIRFEDLPEGHAWEDWDYNDQVIEVEIIAEEEGLFDDDPWWTEDGQVTICHLSGGDPDVTLQVSPRALRAHLAHGDSEGPCPEEETMGDMYYSTFSGTAQVLYSAEAIARLGEQLSVIRDATRVVVVDRWEGRPSGE